MVSLLLLLLTQAVALQVPAPRGFVNDFAGVIDSAATSRMDALIQELRTQTRGEIAVVTLADLGGREAADVALQIGRQWGVGAKAEAGDPAKNLGVVVLLVPLKNHQAGTGRLWISTGRGAEGFLNDARVGAIRDSMTPYLAREDYGTGLAVGVRLLARAFAKEFHVTLDTAVVAPAAPPAEEERPLPGAAVGIVALLALLIFLRAASRAARLGRGRRRGWWSGGGWGGWGGGGWSGGGGGGGGFGGFGGGGGFSGGGAGGKF